MENAVTRRAVLNGLAGSALALAGCLGRPDPVSVLAAGSLQNAFDAELAALGRVELEAHGSTRAARMVAGRHRDPDVLALADVALFSSILESPWHAVFASNAIVLAYNPDTEDGRRVADADTWYEPLLSRAVSLGRTDPDLDPLGYRTLFALALADDHHDEPGLADVTRPEQVYPETQLLAQFETGGIDAAFVYRSMAEERDYPYRDLPAAIDLSDPAYADRYADATYTLPDGTVLDGDAIRYGATLRRDRDDARRIFDALITHADYLTDHGFVIPETYPTYAGTVPDTLAT